MVSQLYLSPNYQRVTAELFSSFGLESAIDHTIEASAEYVSTFEILRSQSFEARPLSINNPLT